MNALLRFKVFLWIFSHIKVPLIGFTRPKLLNLDDEGLVIKIKLNHRTRNHLHSMYFGTLAVGADLAGGLHGFYYAQKLKQNISLVFKSFQAQFIKRAESDVFFVFSEGLAVSEMIAQSIQTKTRINQPVHINAYTHYLETPELVATFVLELSVKVL